MRPCRLRSPAQKTPAGLFIGPSLSNRHARGLARISTLWPIEQHPPRLRCTGDAAAHVPRCRWSSNSAHAWPAASRHSGHVYHVPDHAQHAGRPQNRHPTEIPLSCLLDTLATLGSNPGEVAPNSANHAGQPSGRVSPKLFEHRPNLGPMLHHSGPTASRQNLADSGRCRPKLGRSRDVPPILCQKWRSSTDHQRASRRSERYPTQHMYEGLLADGCTLRC